MAKETCFSVNGSTFTPADKSDLVVSDILPAGTYNIFVDNSGQYHLSKIDDMTLPNKVYGNAYARAARIINTFQGRTGNTGVLLTGDKGSGKTLLAKMVSVLAYASGIPTIVINAPYRGDGFNSFLQRITQPCIIVFDEFEKVYDRDKQNDVLTLLDGVYNSRKLFLITVNDKYGVNQYMRNRPGRVFYAYDYVGLEDSFVTEYCNDALEDKAHIPMMLQVSGMFQSFNFDMLKAIVEEMNRYKETPQQVLAHLNADPLADTTSNLYNRKFTYKMKLPSGEPVPDDMITGSLLIGSPLSSDGVWGCFYKSEEDKNNGYGDLNIAFAKSDIIHMGNKGCYFTLRNAEGYVMEMVRRDGPDYKPFQYLMG